MFKHSFQATNPTGFSIIELLVVVMVLGILVSLAGISIRRYQRSVEGDLTASGVSQTIRLIRERAIAERATFRLSLKKDGTKPGDVYIVEKWVYDPLTGTGSKLENNSFQLPKGWRFGKPTGDIPDPRGLSDLLGSASQTYLLFKADGSIRGGNSGALVTNPTLEVGTRPVNGTIFLDDVEEPDPAVRKYKPRSITLLGATGRTAVWKLFPTGTSSEWRCGNQVS